MSTIDLYPDSSQPPAVVLGDLDLSASARELLGEAPNTRRFLNDLMEAELFADSFGVLASALPKNFAIVWARECVASVDGKSRADSATQCLSIVDGWLKAPDEVARRKAMEAADDADYAHPEAWLAGAVAWSSGSLAPDDQAVVRPPDTLTAVAVAASLSMLAAEEPEQFAERSRKFIERGLGLVAKPESP